jgi:hypothetical protein
LDDKVGAFSLVTQTRFAGKASFADKEYPALVAEQSVTGGDFTNGRILAAGNQDGKFSGKKHTPSGEAAAIRAPPAGSPQKGERPFFPGPASRPATTHMVRNP